jgi:hypothetical protein
MREMEGYALLGRRNVRSADGVAGRELTFGHDEQGKPFRYRMRLYVAGDQLVLAEAGGGSEQMKRLEPSVDFMLRTLRVD